MNELKFLAVRCFGLPRLQLAQAAITIAMLLPFAACDDDSGVVCPASRVTGFYLALACESEVAWTTEDKIMVRVRREDTDTWRSCGLNPSGSNLPVCGHLAPNSILCDISEGGSERFAKKYFIEASVVDVDGSVWSGESSGQWGKASDSCPPDSSSFKVNLSKSPAQ